MPLTQGGLSVTQLNSASTPSVITRSWPHQGVGEERAVVLGGTAASSGFQLVPRREGHTDFFHTSPLMATTPDPGRCRRRLLSEYL